MSEEIKNCPFCGYNAQVIYDGQAFYHVSCDVGCTHGGNYYSEDEAIKSWNTRVEPEPTPSVDIDELSEEVSRDLDGSICWASSGFSHSDVTKLIKSALLKAQNSFKTEGEK